VTSEPAQGCPGQDVSWTAVGGFGPGQVQHYRYLFDQSATHTFDGSEPVWSAGTLVTTPSAAETWYLHVQAFNADDVPSGQFAFALPIPDTDADGTVDCQDGCAEDADKTAPGVCGCGVPDINQTSIHENGQPLDSPVVIGGTAVFSVGASGVNLAYQWHSASGPLADDAKFSGTMADTLEIANVDNNDIAAGPYHVVISGDCGPPVISEPADIVLASPPTITAWRSVRTHAASGDLHTVLDASASGNGLAGPAVECRQGGILNIQIDFDQEVLLVEPGAVSVSGQTTLGGVLQPSVNYSAQAGVSMIDEDTLQIDFAPGALPDATCYTVKIAGTVENVAAQALTGPIQCLVRSLVGDTTQSGDVTLTDALVVKAAVSSGTPAHAEPALDVDVSGNNIETTDAMAAKSRVASPTPQALCP
jgi:hypothetical protein